jgi:sporulation protein YlmC with PRC-barrel domain
MKDLFGYQINATDGAMGKVKNFYFDDKWWTIRYLVADTGTWLVGRQVLISPQVLCEPEWGRRLFPVSLTKRQVEESPNIAADEPVSRQHEEAIAKHYKWAAWGATAYGVGHLERRAPKEPDGDPHLRSANEVRGYAIDASDGEIGHVSDFILDTKNWGIRYLIVSTSNWLPGREVLLSPSWIADIDWPNRQVRVALTREAIKSSPTYNPNLPINREYEEVLYDYYGRPHYWKAGA